MDLTTVDPVIQEPDAGVISDSMKAHPISTILDSQLNLFSVVVMRPLPMTWTAQGYVMKLLGDLSIGNRENKQR
jgi:hypothetical protein